MDVKGFLKKHPKETAERVAVAAGTTYAYLEQLAGGHRKPSVMLTKRLVLESGGEMSLHELRPDIWANPIAGLQPAVETNLIEEIAE